MNVLPVDCLTPADSLSSGIAISEMPADEFLWKKLEAPYLLWPGKPFAAFCLLLEADKLLYLPMRTDPVSLPASFSSIRCWFDPTFEVDPGCEAAMV